MSVSTVFYPSHDAGTGRPDVTVVSADYVYFYAHAEKLLQQSGNRFNALLPPDMTHISHEQPMLVHVPEEATVLNIVLHAIYGWSSSSFGHSVDQIRLAVNSLEKYGVSLEECLSPDSPLRSLILSHAQLRPIEMYAMAAAHHLESLAVSVSSMLLSYPLLSLTDELAIQMGAAYLRRLVLLHEKRMDLLRGLVLAPPDTHRTTNTCTFEQQKDLTSAWALTVAELAWQASPGALSVDFRVGFRADILWSRSTDNALAEDAWRD